MTHDSLFTCPSLWHCRGVLCPPLTLSLELTLELWFYTAGQLSPTLVAGHYPQLVAIEVVLVTGAQGTLSWSMQPVR